MALKTSSGRVALPKLMAVLVGVLFAGVVLPAPASAAAAPVYQQTWGTNGHVSAILADPASGRVYVAGNFTAVTDATGTTSLPIANVAAFDPATGTFDASWDPNPNGPVTALALSGGELYLGGTFTKVGAQIRTHVAAVDPAGTGVPASWAPAVTGGGVDALAVNGGWVYLSGNFTSVAGVARSFLGRVGVSTGTLDTGWTPQPDARVRSLAMSADGSHVYIGGDFLTVNGSTNGRSIASISTTNPGSLTVGFNAGATNMGGEAPALALYLDGSNLLAGVGGSGGGCASLNATTGATQWSKHGNGNVQAVTAVGGTVYCGGHFSGSGSFDGQTRDKLAAVDEVSGVLLSYSFRINSALGIWALDHDAGHVYLGGDFTKINGSAQPHFAVLATAAAPMVTTGGASSVTSAGATVKGTVNPEGSDTTYYFEYGTDTTYGTTTTPGSAGAGTTAQSVSAALTGLTGSTTYHYRLVATNANGTTDGTDATFTTKSAPGVTTGAATGITSTGATVKGTVNPHGSDTTYYFQYGIDTTYGSSTTPGSAGAGSTAVSVSASLGGLASSTTYHYRLVATNASGSTTLGGDRTFTTLAP
ncbi:MAG: hypothetical protein QOI06_3099 [Nocardioidaceae bacterium]|jgi:hypothetical protein|nr:hypothetical protein [Nocardioidaceae bacterium]